MNKKLVKTPCGIPVGEAVSTKNGEPGLEIRHKGKTEIISLKYLIEQVKKIHQFVIMCSPTVSQYAGVEALKNIINKKDNSNSRNTEQGA